jgi:hypothetical protein
VCCVCCQAVRADASGHWQPTSTWQQLEADLAAEQRRLNRQAASPTESSTISSSNDGSSQGQLALQSWQAKLRMPLTELEQLWQQRMQVSSTRHLTPCSAACPAPSAWGVVTHNHALSALEARAAHIALCLHLPVCPFPSTPAHCCYAPGASALSISSCHCSLARPGIGSWAWRAHPTP